MFYRPRSKALMATILTVMLFYQFWNYQVMHLRLRYWADSSMYWWTHDRTAIGSETIGAGFEAGKKLAEAITGFYAGGRSTKIQSFEDLCILLLILLVHIILLCVFCIILGPLWMIIWVVVALVLGALASMVYIHIFPTLITVFLAFWPVYPLTFFLLTELLAE